MEQRDPEQRQREQDEVNGYSKHQHTFRPALGRRTRSAPSLMRVSQEPTSFDASLRRKLGHRVGDCLS
jgi:hypothetical protein